METKKNMFHLFWNCSVVHKDAVCC